MTAEKLTALLNEVVVTATRAYPPECRRKSVGKLFRAVMGRYPTQAELDEIEGTKDPHTENN